jgi:hypothetical protein
MERQNGSSGGLDSGYGSVVSSIASTLSASKRKANVLRHFDIPINEELQHRFLDIRMLYGPALLEAITKKKDGPCDVSMKLKYLGKDENSAQPYVIVTCDKQVAKRVKKFFAQEHVRQSVEECFRLHINDTGLVRLTVSESGGMRVSGNLSGRRSFCGMSLHIDSSEATCTFGGLIMVSKMTGDTIYGFTAGHPLAQLRQINSEDSESSAALYSSSCSSGTDDEDETTSEIEFENDDSCVPFAVEGNANQNNDSMILEMDEIGEITDDFFGSVSTTNYDWALIDLSIDELLPNTLPDGHLPLIDHSDGADGLDLGGSLPASSSIANVSGLRAIVLTPIGMQRGTLFANASSISMTPGTQFVDSLDFLPDKGYGKCLDHLT